MKERKTYTLHLCGLTRELPIISVSDTLAIASFVIPGDTGLIEKAGRELVAKLKARFGPDCGGAEYLVCPEAKAVPLAHAMARIMGLDYIVVRKSVKAYMRDVCTVSSSAITTAGDQSLVLDGRDAERLKDRRIIIVDDVVSTGGSLEAMQKLLCPLHCDILAKAAILLEEGGYPGEDLVYLEKLPVFPLSRD